MALQGGLPHWAPPAARIGGETHLGGHRTAQPGSDPPSFAAPTAACPAAVTAAIPHGDECCSPG